MSGRRNQDKATTDIDKALLAAAGKMDLCGVRKALDCGAWVHVSDENRTRPLGVFVEAWLSTSSPPDPAPFISLLAEAGADLARPTGERYGPHTLESLRGTDDDVPLVEALFDEGMKVGWVVSTTPNCSPGSSGRARSNSCGGWCRRTTSTRKTRTARPHCLPYSVPNDRRRVGDLTGKWPQCSTSCSPQASTSRCKTSSAASHWKALRLLAPRTSQPTKRPRRRMRIRRAHGASVSSCPSLRRKSTGVILSHAEGPSVSR